MFDHIDNSVNDDLYAATGTIVDTDFEGDVNTLHFSAMFLSRLTHICIHNATLFLLGHEQKITAFL